MFGASISYISYITIITLCQEIFHIDYLRVIGYIFTMATNKPKILFVVEKELIERIDNYRFDNRINSRSEAIRRLLDECLKIHEGDNQVTPLA